MKPARNSSLCSPTESADEQDDAETALSFQHTSKQGTDRRTVDLDALVHMASEG